MAKFDSYSNIDLIFEQGLDMINFYRSHPIQAAYDLLKVDLAPVQRLVLRDMWFKNFTITVMSRGGGKTYLLAVNAALHCLLYPGYRVGLIGPSFRQCFFEDLECLPIFTDKGLFTSPAEFYDSIDSTVSVQSLDKPNKICNKWVNDEAEGVVIKTTRGFELGGLYKHRILIFDGVSLVWKNLGDITKHDCLVIKKGFKLFGNNNTLPSHILEDGWRTNKCNIPEKLTEDASYLFGLVVGDGCVSYTDRKYRINLTSEDDVLLDRFKTAMKSAFGITNISSYTNNGVVKQLEVYNKNLCDFFIKCGFTTTSAVDKKIPRVINRADDANVAAFLSGLMDADGGVNIQKAGATVGFSTSSIKLAKEVQAWFLNFGILSSLGVDKEACKRKLNGREKYSDCSTSYKVRITNVLDMIKFRDLIGFKLERKKNLLDDYLKSVNMDKIKNSHVIPKCENHVKRLVDACSKMFKYGDVYQNKFLGYFKNKFGKSSGFTSSKIKQLLQFAEEYGVINESYDRLKDLISLDLVFVRPKSFTVHKAKTIDIEVAEESCYWAGGFINHNSKLIFSEIEKLYNRSSVLREACEKKPTRGADSCFLRFKGTDKTHGSYIEALPIGVDGAKIRGSRFYLIQIDELAQMPSEIIDMVIRPMAAVSSEPMERVREWERRQELVAKGLADEDDFDEITANKMIMTSSGYFKFNHMWRRMCSYWQAIKEEGENTKYAVHQIPHTLMPVKFLDEENIKESKRIMSRIEFMMEYEAAMVSDSDGFFKASMLEACTIGSGFSLQLSGEPGKEYVMGVDPNQGGSAGCGVVIVELGMPNRLVFVKEFKKKTTQQMVVDIQKLTDVFNIKRIFMDSQGGGKALKDLLQEGYKDHIPIIDIEDEAFKTKDGKRILKLVNPSPLWISDANFDTLALLESKQIRFPELPMSSEPITEALYEDVRKLKSQILNIFVTQTARGVAHFDTPKKSQNKDLYSAFVLASWGAKDLAREMPSNTIQVISNGLVRPHQSGARFTRMSGGTGLDYTNSAVLKKK